MTQNLKASVVVFLVALPLCLGIALASNAPLSAGVFAGIIGGVVVGFFSGSQISVSGPAAGLTVIVANAIFQLGSFAAFCLAVLIAGAFQIIFGLLKSGDLAQFFPSSVIKGMLAAIGVILIMKQGPVLVGWHEGEMNRGVAIIGVVALLFLMFWENVLQPRFKLARLVPGALVAVFIGIAINQFAFKGSDLLVSQNFLVSLPYDGSWGGFWSSLKLPHFESVANPIVWKVALTIALVASLETLLSLDAADKMDPLKRISHKNQELIAQGIGNATCGLVGALPVTAVIVRTTANVSAGGVSRSSAIIHGLWLLFSAMLIPQYLNLIPLSVLSAVLLLVGYKLCKPKLFLEQFKAGKTELFIFVVTIVAIIATDLLLGIAVGMVVGLSFTLKQYKRQSFDLKSQNEEWELHFHSHVTFLHKLSLSNALKNIPNGSKVTISRHQTVTFHPDIHQMLHDFNVNSEDRNIKVTQKL